MTETRDSPRNKGSVRISRWFPETGAGAYTSIDGTVEFYTRVQSLLREGMEVLDFGAGRGAALQMDTSPFRRSLRNLRGKAARVVACDVDEAVRQNPGADEVFVIRPNERLPFPNEVFDIILSDFVFEHIDDPNAVSEELNRVLKPGGWICARTPNRYCLVSLAARLVHGSMHSWVLQWVQPERSAVDVFPTVYKLNSKSQIARWFPADKFENFTYRYESEPSYVFDNTYIMGAALAINRLLPPIMKSGLFVFLRKRCHS